MVEEAEVKEEVLKGVDDVLFDANAGAVPTTIPLPPPLPPTPTSFRISSKIAAVLSVLPSLTIMTSLFSYV